MLGQEGIELNERLCCEGGLEKLCVLELRGVQHTALFFLITRSEKRLAGGRLAKQATIGDLANVGGFDVYAQGFWETVLEFEKRACDWKCLLGGGNYPGFSEPKVFQILGEPLHVENQLRAAFEELAYLINDEDDAP